MEAEDWGVVTAASGLTNARIITGRLETEGIPTRLRYEAAGAIYAITIDGLGEVKISSRPGAGARPGDSGPVVRRGGRAGRTAGDGP